MKKVLCILGFLVLAAELPLWSYDAGPSSTQIIPEAIWAPATGGGTWVTELQILNIGSTTVNVMVFLAYSGGSTASFQVCSSLFPYRSARFSNILSTLDSLDSSSFVYYGRVGALWVSTVEASGGIQVQAKTVNGNYGKTFPGMKIAEGNTAAFLRPMIINDLVKNATYRTFIGAYNTGSVTYQVQFTIYNANNVGVGQPFVKTLPANAFMSFDPFIEAVAPAGNYEGCWLLIYVQSGGTGADGVLCFGSIANNYTNDTYALIARAWY